MSKFPKKPVFEAIRCVESGGNSTGLIEASNINVLEQIYCKKLIVTDELTIPSTNDEQSKKTTVVVNNKPTQVNRNLAKISYDAKIRDLKTSNNVGSKESISKSDNSISSNTRYKELLFLEGWSPNSSEFFKLKQNSGNVGIELDDHVYYQGHGYIVGLYNNADDENIYTPCAYMSRLDYFLLTMDSYSTLDESQINYLGCVLLNSTEADVKISISKVDTRYQLDISVKGNKEMKWYAVLSLQKIRLLPGSDKDTKLSLEYGSSDNNILWEPTIGSDETSECIIKLMDGVKFKMISPFAEKIVDSSQTYNDSIIDNSIEITTKNVKKMKDYDENSRREYVGKDIFLGLNSSKLDYNNFLYFNTLLIQPSNENTKKLTTSYGHSGILLDHISSDNHDITTNELLLGNSFTKTLTKDEFNFNSHYIVDNNDFLDKNNDFIIDENGNNISNKKIRFVFQLKEKEFKYKPLIAVVYYKMFAAKKIDDKDDSVAHRDEIFDNLVTTDLSQHYQQSYLLYKKIGDLIADTSTRIYTRDNGSNSVYYFNIGTHHFIKSFISIRDITNNKCCFFIHTSSVIIPSFAEMRSFFVNQKEQGINDINIMTTNFSNKYINENTVINNIESVNFEELDTYDGDRPFNYINNETLNYIDNTDSTISLNNFIININTAPILESTNKLSAEYSLEEAYNNFQIKFPIYVNCISKFTSKYQTYIMLEVNKFKLDNY